MGVPWPGPDGDYPSQVQMGSYPGQVQTGGYPRVPSQLGNRRGTCYAAGGMPLAFTQEDFLVQNIF